MRELNNWIDGFLNFTANLPSPEIFRRWAGICAVAGALERRVWVRAFSSEVYPHLYVVLVGPPGVGKTTVTSRVWELWESLSDEGHFVASTSVTGASLIDDLRDAERRLFNSHTLPAAVSFNSLKICSNDLGTLLPAWDNDLMSKLTDIWDCKPYKERRRTSKLNFTIERPQFNIIAGTTPSHLNHVLPEGAWEQGFMSRVICVFSGEYFLTDLFEEPGRNNELWSKLLSDFKEIDKLYGKYEFEKKAAACVREWHLAGGPPQPEHPKLMYYCIRRTAQLLKLSMVSAAAQGDELTITLDDVQQGLDWLIEAETYMPDIFKSMSMGGSQRIFEDTWYFMYQIYMKKKEPIPEHRIVNFIAARVPEHSVMKILELMQKTKLIEKQLDGYVPRSKKE